jgi:hypothetical protein
LPRAAAAKSGVELDPAVGDTLGDSKPFKDVVKRYRRDASG